MERITKFNKSQAKDRERNKENTTKPYRGETTYNTDTKIIIRGYNEQLSARVFGNLVELDTFLEKYNLSKWTHTKNKFIVKNLLKTKTAHPDDFTGEFFQT